MKLFNFKYMYKPKVNLQHINFYESFKNINYFENSAHVNIFSVCSWAYEKSLYKRKRWYSKHVLIHIAYHDKKNCKSINMFKE